jgi:hypothetical protein
VRSHFGKAGKGTADPRSMNGALKLGSQMAINRRAAAASS